MFTKILSAFVFCLGVSSANSATILFSFDNEDGALSGTVSGTITLPDGDGTFAATAVEVTFAPAGMGYTLPADFFTHGVIENTFTIVGGNIDFSSSRYFGLFNGDTALALNTSFVSGSSFLDIVNAANFGATGVLDADSSTLRSSISAVPEISTTGVLSMVFCSGFLLRRNRRNA